MLSNLGVGIQFLQPGLAPLETSLRGRLRVYERSNEDMTGLHDGLEKASNFYQRLDLKTKKLVRVIYKMRTVYDRATLI